MRLSPEEHARIQAKAVEVASHVNGGAGGRVEIVGAWLWIYFPGKPPVEVRDYLKGEGAHWNTRRSCWQISNGYRSKPSRYDAQEVKAHYGVELVADDASPEGGYTARAAEFDPQ